MTSPLTEFDVSLPGGAVVHGYDTGGDGIPLVWHHGTPNIGPPPEPLFAPARALGLRWVGYDRPGYGGSTSRPGRDIASAAADVAALTGALGIRRYAVAGQSGGGPHALASAALGDGVIAALVIASLAPPDAEGLDWYAGMIASGANALRSAAQGRAARTAAEDEEYDPEFTASDLAALQAEWGWFGSVVGPAVAAGPGPAIDDDLAYARPWGFEVSRAAVPVLVLHGEDDGIVPVAHGRWPASHLPSATLRTYAGAGHLSVMTHAAAALGWVADQV